MVNKIKLANHRLKHKSNNDMLSIVDAQMQKEIEKMKNECILKNHPYNIFQSTDGRYRTYVMDGTKRKMIAKSSREAVELAIINFYKTSSMQNKCTLKTLYLEWLQYKTSTCAISTLNRIECDWNKYYLNCNIITLPIAQLNYITLNQWANSIVKEKNLTKKQYMNISLIIRQLLLYAEEKEIIQTSPFKRVKVTKNLFSTSQKKASETQVFLNTEQPMIEAEAYKDYEETKNSACLAIILAFQTGLRIGELVALKYHDIEDDYLNVQRMERIQRIKNDDGGTTVEYIIVPHVKSNAGYRHIFLTKKAKDTLNLLKTKDCKNSDYIFTNSKGRIHKRAVDTRIRKYCKNCGIQEKSLHKVRKTFISALIDSQININYIRQVAGHESEKTTYHNYCFNRLSEQETNKKFEKALISM